MWLRSLRVIEKWIAKPHAAIPRLAFDLAGFADKVAVNLAIEVLNPDLLVLLFVDIRSKRQIARIQIRR